MSSPFAETSSVTNTPTLLLMLTAVLLKTVPENTNPEAPLPDLPFVVMYDTEISFPFSNFLPKTPSPKKSSYFSSEIS